MLIGNPMVFRQLPLEMALAKAAAAGYDAFELWPPQLTECSTPELRRQLAARIRDFNVQLIRLNCADRDYFQSLNSPHDVSAALTGLRTDIDMAADMGMTQLLSWEGRKGIAHSDQDAQGWVLDATVDLFQQACAYGREKNVSLTVEVHPFTLGIDIDWLVRLCDAVDDPDFSVTYDCCHFAVGLPDDYIEAIRKLGKRIGHLHFSDSDKQSSELHFAPGTGCLDLDGIVAALVEVGFSGTVMLDLWLYPLPERGAEIGVPYVRQVIEKLGVGS